MHAQLFEATTSFLPNWWKGVVKVFTLPRNVLQHHLRLLGCCSTVLVSKTKGKGPVESPKTKRTMFSKKEEESKPTCDCLGLGASGLPAARVACYVTEHHVTEMRSLHGQHVKTAGYAPGTISMVRSIPSYGHGARIRGV